MVNICNARTCGLLPVPQVRVPHLDTNLGSCRGRPSLAQNMGEPGAPHTMSNGDVQSAAELPRSNAIARIFLTGSQAASAAPRYIVPTIQKP